MSICCIISVKSVRIDRQCDSTFANGEVVELRKLKELRRMSCCLKYYAKKTIVLTPQRP